MTKAIIIFYREYFEEDSDVKSAEECLSKIVTGKIILSPAFDVLKYHSVETKALKVGSLFPSDEVRIENPNLHLNYLLEENIKREEPDDFFVMAYGKKEIDEEIWRQVSRFSQNATMLHATKKGYIKVTGIRESYFEGDELIFPSK